MAEENDHQTCTRPQLLKLLKLLSHQTRTVRCKTEGSARFWRSVAKEMNKFDGSAIRDGQHWKRVWQHLKSNTEKKVALHMTAIKENGEAPCNLEAFDVIENRVIVIANLNRCITITAFNPTGTSTPTSSNSNESHESLGALIESNRLEKETLALSKEKTENEIQLQKLSNFKKQRLEALIEKKFK